MIPLALYLHFPWCVRKCPYCDFNSHPLQNTAGETRDLPQAQYLEALLADLEAQLDPVRPITSVFCGGGTPSLFAPEVFASLLGRVPNLTRDAEVTMEANPGATEHAALGAYRSAGINRLSIGAQSFDGASLAALGRIHGAADTARCFAQARRAGFTNINLDLMYGLPGQTLSGALADLEAAIALVPEHISWYQLTIEPRTEFAVRKPRLPPEDRIITMEARGRERLAAAGYVRYEISAYARAGHQCRHNLNYWSFGDYLGVGAGAHGKLTDGGRVLRTEKARQPRLYQRDSTAMLTREVGGAELPGEFMMNALRLTSGVSRSTFVARTGLDWAVVEPIWRAAAAAGLVETDRIATTALGYQYLDSVLGHFV